MKRRFFVFGMAIMAFLAIPLRPNAAADGATGNIGGCDVKGYVNIDDSSANATTSCEGDGSYCTVSVTYYYIDETLGTIKAVSASNAGQESAVNVFVGKLGADQGHVCKSYKVISTHSVAFESYVWNPSLIAYYP